MRILIIEDDAETATYLINGLQQTGHVVDHAEDGSLGLMLAARANYDAMVVDRMLPKVDGLALVKRLREICIKTPVLFLTALGSIDDRVAGLEAGGDDYLLKPFAFSELLARLNALARRPPLEDVTRILKVGDLELDLMQRQVRRAGKPIDIQPREFHLLHYLMSHAGRIVTRTMLLENVWEFNFDPRTKIVETHISRLRAKVDRDADRQLIHTVRGAGYVIRPPS